MDEIAEEDLLFGVAEKVDHVGRVDEVEPVVEMGVLDREVRVDQVSLSEAEFAGGQVFVVEGSADVEVP